MTEERREWAARAPWPWWKRWPMAVLKFAFGMFVTKHEDGTIGPSWTAIFGGALLIVLIERLPPNPPWSYVFLVFATLYVKPINDAMKAVAKRNPEKIVDALLSRMGAGGDGGSMSFSVGGSTTAEAAPPPPPASDGALG